MMLEGTRDENAQLTHRFLGAWVRGGKIRLRHPRPKAAYSTPVCRLIGWYKTPQRLAQVEIGPRRLVQQAVELVAHAVSLSRASMSGRQSLASSIRSRLPRADHALSLEELQAVHGRMFKYADADNDGKLTIQELRNFHAGDLGPEQDRSRPRAQAVATWAHESGKHPLQPASYAETFP